MQKNFSIDQDELLKILIADSEHHFSGWDFSYINDRIVSGSLTWSYTSKILPLVRKTDSMLDMGTGGGEFLSSLMPLPKQTCATEAYQSNIHIAKKRLEPIGVKVVQIEEQAPLPFHTNEFGLIINRHEWYSPEEVFRILKPKGRFITQQVGERNESKLRFLLTGKEMRDDPSEWNLAYAVKELQTAGFTILEQYETVTFTRIFDVGAIIFNLKAVPWELPDFSVKKYYEKLRKIQNLISQKGFIDLESNHHRFFIMAKKS